ncbi:glutamate receptor 2.2, partial [Prunus dulcis]
MRGIRRPRRHTRTTRQSGSDTKLSHPDRLRRSAILSALGLATFSPARTVLFLGAHEATSQGGHHPGIAPASNSLNFGVPTNPKPVSSQKASQ